MPAKSRVTIPRYALVNSRIVGDQVVGYQATDPDSIIAVNSAMKVWSDPRNLDLAKATRELNSRLQKRDALVRRVLLCMPMAMRPLNRSTWQVYGLMPRRIAEQSP